MKNSKNGKLHTLDDGHDDDEPGVVPPHLAVEVLGVEVVEEDEVRVHEERDREEGHHVPHAVVRVELELAARLGEVVHVVAGVEDLERYKTSFNQILFPILPP